MCSKCDVTNWDDQVALFELAERTYRAVDIVVRLTLFTKEAEITAQLQIPNAGIATSALPTAPLQIVDGKPVRPNHRLLLDINVNAVIDSER